MVAQRAFEITHASGLRGGHGRGVMMISMPRLVVGDPGGYIVWDIWLYSDPAALGLLTITNLANDK